MHKYNELLKYYETTSPDQIMSILFKKFWHKPYRDNFLKDIKKTCMFKDEVLNVMFGYISIKRSGKISKQDFIALAAFLERKQVDSASQALSILREANRDIEHV